MDEHLRLQISEEGADAERLAVLARYLRTELLRLDVEEVTAPQVGEAPPGARGVDATDQTRLIELFVSRHAMGEGGQ